MAHLLGSDRFSLGWYLSKCGSLFTSLVVLITLLHELTQLYGRAAEANAQLASLARQDTPAWPGRSKTTGLVSGRMPPTPKSGAIMTACPWR